jgi:hypothetical protein
MTTATEGAAGAAAKDSRWQRIGPVITLLVLVFVPNPPAPAWIAVIAGCVWVVTALLALRHMSNRPGWGDLHRWALIFGAMLVCMLGGFLGSSTWAGIDIIDKAVMSLVALIWMLWFERSLRRRTLRKAEPAITE